MIIILIGNMGVGKTTFAKKFAKENNYEFISYDNTYNLVHQLNNCDLNKNYIVDGMVREFLELKVPYEIWVMVAPEEIVKMRRPSDISLESLEKTTKGDLKFADKIIYPDYDLNEVSVVVSKYMEDSKYQNIWFPYDITNLGSHDCEKSWDRIKDLVDWKDKKVIDLGCSMGYFLFKAMESGAKEAIGYDVEEVCRIARKFSYLKHLTVDFRAIDLDTELFKEKADVILLLNTLHHLRSPFFVLRQCFENGKVVILEVEVPQDHTKSLELGELIILSQKGLGHHFRFNVLTLDQLAHECGKKLVDSKPSARPNRVILVFK